jgi:HlyD family secretion protein
VLLLVLGGGVGAWAATTQIAGAVVATGALVVDINVQKVQHPTGGIVGEIRARDGDVVKIGDVVIRLDETVTRANLAIVSKGLDEFSARKARLEAERDGSDTIVFPEELIPRKSEPQVADSVAGERKLFELRRAARDGQKSRLGERIAQLEEEIGGLTAQSRSKAREILLIEKELAGARELWEKNLMSITKLTMLERDAVRLEGERAQLVAATAQAKGRITETELQVIQIDRELASEVGKELRDVEARIGELVERKVQAQDQLKRVDIRAPQAGTVHQSTVHTVGGVVAAGEPIMLIVPAGQTLIAEAKVAAQDIDQLRLGQAAVVRFSAFQRTTPELNGTVSRISADAVADPRTAAAYYTVRIFLTGEELAKLGEIRLIPGMPVEVFIQTGDRTVIAYLMKPLYDQIKRAFRER